MVVQSEEPLNENTEEQDVDDKKQRLRQRFQVVKKLGQGTYGKVQLAINKETKQEVAVKTIRKAKIENEQDLLRIRREIQIMSSVQHPHIIHIYEVFENSEKIVFIMQYASGGELYDYLSCHKKLPEKEARRIFRQIAAAIYYCHKNKICHRDLKLENIILDDKGNAKIADFGLSNVFDEKKKLHTFCGSPLYASPEIVKGTPYCGPEVDCWSLGVLLYTLVYGAMPFDGSNFKRLVKQISEGDYCEPKLKSKASGIIRLLLTVDVALRANINDICNDEWVNESYDHSLIKVANDLASWSPVSTSILTTLSRRNESFSNSTKKNMVIDKSEINKDQQHDFTMVVKRDVREGFKVPNLNEGCCSRSVENSRTSNVFNTAKRETDPLIANSEKNTSISPSNEGILLSSLSNEMGNNEYLTGGNDCVNGDFPELLASGELLQTSDRKIYKKSKSNRSQLSNNGEINEQELNISNNDMLSRYVSNSDISKDYIPNKTLNSTLQRTSAVEKFRAWRSSLNQTKSIETESIMPIFEVTSIVPKRSSDREGDYESKKVILNQTETQRRAHENRNKENYKDNIVSPIIHLGNVVSKVSNTETNCDQSFTATKERNDVIYHLQNVCSQRKLSNELENQFLSTIKNQTPVLKPYLTDDVSGSQKPIYKDTDVKSDNGESVIFDASSEIPNSTQQIKSVCTGENMQLPVNEEISSEIYEKTEKCEIDETYLQSDEVIHIKDSKHSTTEENCVQRDTFSYLKQCLHSHEESEKNEILNNLSVTYLDFLFKQKEQTNVQNDSNNGTNILPECKTMSVLNTTNTQAKFDNSFVDENSLSHIPVNDDSTEKKQSSEKKRLSRNNFNKKIKTRSCSVDNDERMTDLEKILRRPRKYSLCALLAESFEFEKLISNKARQESESFKRLPGKVTIPKSFDSSSESDVSTAINKKEVVLIPSISVAENKQKIEKKIEKVKLSALSMKPKRKSEITRRKLKKYTRSCTDVLQCIGNLSDTVNIYQNTPSFSCDLNINRNSLNKGCHALFNETRPDQAECKFAAVNFLNEEENMPTETIGSLELSSLGYVPITRCCKKITFPPEYSINPTNQTTWPPDDVITNRTQPFSAIHLEEHLRDMYEEQGIVSKRKNSSSRLKRENIPKNYSCKLNRKEIDSNSTSCCKNQEEYSDLDQSQSNDSLNSIPFERDSSDNDDELYTLGSNFEICDSGDLWNFLKSINTDFSHHIKQVKRKPIRTSFSRSKSQECNMLKDSCDFEKSFNRSSSVSEEEKQHQVRKISSFSSEGYSNPYSLSMNESPLQISHIATESLPQNQLDKKGQNSSNNLCFKNKPRYYSLSNLNDSSPIFRDSSLWESRDNTKSDLCINYLNMNNRCAPKTELLGKSLPCLEQQSTYSSMRLKRLGKNQRSQSHMDGINYDEYVDSKKLSNRVDLRGSHKKHSSAGSNRTLSDLLGNNESETDRLRYSKSFGSKLSFEPRSILTDSHIKSQQRNCLKDDIIHRKRNRRVSFTIDAAKEEHSNFVLASIAKAQKALSNVERQSSNNEINEDQGTLLEALKNQGYKSIMSQRLQNNEPENEPRNRRYSLACLMKCKPLLQDYTFTDSLLSEDFLDPAEYAKRIRWSRNFLHSLGSVSNDHSEIEYNDWNLNGSSDTMFDTQTDTNCCKLPNMWLYQNVEDLRPDNFDNLHREMPLSTDCNFHAMNNWSLPKNDNFVSKRSKSDGLSHVDNYTDMDHERSLGFKSEQLTELDGPIEKSAMKLKMLKNKFYQKSFDESLHPRNVNTYKESTLHRNEKGLDELLLEVEPFRDLGTYLGEGTSFETDTISALNKTTDSDKSQESVSDRIWRKSFYSRFNDTSLSRRRSMNAFDVNYPQDKIFVNTKKLRNTDNIKSEETPGGEIKLISKERTNKSVPILNSEHVISLDSSSENIPNHLEINEPVIDATHFVNGANVDD